VITTKTTIILTCDGCGTKAESNSASSLPQEPYRAWARIVWEQDAGFDYHGSPWANRVNTKDHTLTVCPTCADAMMAPIEKARAARGLGLP
jgi:RNase P subunit RPR2